MIGKSKKLLSMLLVFVVVAGQLAGLFTFNLAAVLAADSQKNQATIYYKNGSFSTSYMHYRVEGGTWTSAPGVRMTNAEFAGYHKIVVDLGSATRIAEAAFNNGSGNWDNNGGKNYSFDASTSTLVGGVVAAGQPSFTKTTTIYYATGTNGMGSHIHYQLDGGSWTVAPGVKLAASEYAGYNKIIIDLGTASKIAGAAFNNGIGQWDNNNGSNYSFAAGTFTVKAGQVTAGSPQLVNTVTVYYDRTGGAGDYMHYRIEGASWTTAPGFALVASEVNGYNKVIVELGNAPRITEAAFTNGLGKWDNQAGKNYTFTPGVFTVSNGKAESGAPGATPTPMPTPSVEPSPTPTPSNVPSPTVTPSVEPSPTPTPSNVPSPTVTPSVEPSPTPTPSIEPSPTVTPSVSPIPSVTPTITPSNSPTPTPLQNEVTIYYKQSEYEQAYVHYAVNGSWTVLPGKLMQTAEIKGYYKATIKIGNATELTACFHDGGSQWDRNNGQNYKFQIGTFTLDNGKITAGKPKNLVTIYYDRNYVAYEDKVIYMHYQPMGGQWTTIPGVQLLQSEVPGYYKVTLDLGTATGIAQAAFNYGKVSGDYLWDNKGGDNYSFPTTGAFTVSNNIVTEGAPKYVQPLTTPVFAPKPAETPAILQVAAGQMHSLALTSEGRVLAWGNNQKGQLGNNSNVSSSLPVVVDQSEMGKAVKIAASNFTNLAIDGDGQIWQWGVNYKRAFILAQGDSEIGDYTPRKINQSAMGSAQDIAVGLNYSLALAQDGKVWAWGHNDRYTLGKNAPAPTSLEPVLIDPTQMGKVKAIAAGYNHALALNENGEVWAWGRNFHKALGSQRTDYANPGKVPFPNNVKITAISAGSDFSYALAENGQLWAWGRDDEGQLGDRDTFINGPVQVAFDPELGKSIRSFHAINLTGYIIMQNGDVYHWGDNTENEIPVKLDTVNQITHLAGTKGFWYGYLHQIAIKQNGTMIGWGKNSAGELGLGFVSGSTATLIPPTAIAFDITAPDTPQHLMANTVFANAISLQWNAAGNPAGTTYELYRNGNKIADVTRTTYLDMALTPDTTYSYEIVAKDQVGNKSLPSNPLQVKTKQGTSTVVYYATNAVNDVFMHYRAENGSWTTAPGVKGIASDIPGYKLFILDQVSGIEEAAFYNEQTGWDNKGGLNYRYIDGIVTVADGKIFYQHPETVLPLLNTLLNLKALSDTSIFVEWSQASDNSAIKGYEVYRNGEKIAFTTNMSYTDKELTPLTTYSYRVKAVDIFGNKSIDAPFAPSVQTQSPATKIYFKKQGVTTPYIHYRKVTYQQTNYGRYQQVTRVVGPWTTAPGELMKRSEITGYYKIEFPNDIEVEFVFNDGKGNWFKKSDGNDFLVLRGKTLVYDNGNTSEVEPPKGNTVTVYYKSPFGAKAPFIHFRAENGDWTTAPGIRMLETVKDGYYKITLGIGTATKAEVCFNDGGTSWDTNGGKNYLISQGTFTVNGTSITQGLPK